MLVEHILPPERQHAVEIEADAVGHVPQVPLHQIRREAVDARRHRCMRREDMLRRRGLARLVEGHPRLAAHFGDALEGEERGVALVHVEDRRREPERAQGAHAADA